MDGFSGAGGNIIQYALDRKNVIAIDIDGKKLEISRNNAKIYKVEENIKFVKGDFLVKGPKYKVDLLFMSPPWGGPEYLDKEKYDIEESMTPNVYNILQVSAQIS